MAFIVHGASAFQGAQLDLATAVSQPKEEHALTCMSCGAPATRPIRPCPTLTSSLTPHARAAIVRLSARCDGPPHCARDYAGGFTAPDFEGLREHYKTEWHRHNLKRKVAELAPLTLQEFQERVTAFLSDGGDARSKKKEHLGKRAQEKQAKREQQMRELEEKRQVRAAAQEAGGMEIEEPDEEAAKRAQQPDFASMTEEEYMDWREQNAVKLSPGDSLFDRHCEDSLELNLEYMSITYGFFIPFLDQCVEVPALVEYLGQKLSIGCVCLWCNKAFSSLDSVQAHMRAKSHCKINFEGCEEEYQDFYEVDLLSKSAPVEADDDWETDEEEEVDDMEDVVGLQREDELSRKVVPTQGKIAEAARMSKKHAKTVNVLELGAQVLGHRAFQKYYRQKLRPECLGKYRHRSDANTKIQLLLTDVYRANNVVTVYKGGSRIAKNNKHTAKRDIAEQDRWWMRMGIKTSKFHQVRRCDYHA